MAHDQQHHYYGKGDVLVYRTYARPLRGITPILESAYQGRSGLLLAASVTMIARGQAFLESYTDGENRHVVATDSMKNFILRMAAEFDGSTMESFLEFTARRFLDRYDHVESVLMSATEVPFAGMQVPRSIGFTDSELVLRATHGDRATATLEMGRDGVISHSSGIVGLQLLKVSGSSFDGFVRDEYTTLPEAHDRPLFTFLDLSWRYANPAHQRGEEGGTYVPAEQVRDLLAAVFHEAENKSIQHLIYLMARRMLQRYPGLTQVQFEGQNRTWEMVIPEIAGSQGRVYTDPRPPYGVIGLTLTREEAGL